MHTNFIFTKEHAKFVEFCDTCRETKYIGLCYGDAGVGKTLSARTYANWERLEQLFKLHYFDLPPEKSAYQRETIFCTAPVYSTPLRVEQSVHKAWRNYETLTGYVQNIIELGPDSRPYSGNSQPPQLIIVDEADRLKTQGLEQIRDIYDQRHVGLVLIGMPGIEKRLSRYPQLYSRVGFLHHYALLKPREVEDILRTQWGAIDGSLDPGEHTDSEVIATIIRTVGGNFRLLQRLMEQTARLMKINDLNVMTKEVVEAARELIIIGRYSAT